MIKFTLVGDELNLFREVLANSVVSEMKRLEEDVSIEYCSGNERTLKMMPYMEAVRRLSSLYMKSINDMEVVDG
jgi:hypothetical protein